MEGEGWRLSSLCGTSPRLLALFHLRRAACCSPRLQEGVACPYLHFVKPKYVQANTAKGPCYARGLGDKLLRYPAPPLPDSVRAHPRSSEDSYFCMQTDSHMMFVEHWDTAVVDEWKKAQNEYGKRTRFSLHLCCLSQRLQGC